VLKAFNRLSTLATCFNTPTRNLFHAILWRLQTPVLLGTRHFGIVSHVVSWWVFRRFNFNSQWLEWNSDNFQDDNLAGCSEGYLMDLKLARATTSFSSCSVRYAKSHLEKLFSARQPAGATSNCFRGGELRWP